MIKAVSSFVLAVLVTGCVGGSSGSTDADNTKTELGNDSLIGLPEIPEADQFQPATVQFIAMGDSGSGSAGHFAVGESMALVCAEKSQTAGPCQFVLGFGDNIYEDGATSINDIQFIDKFEKPFEPMGNTPFYMVLGNHDNTAYVGGDGANNDRGDIQVEYALSGLSPRWKMPDRYYAVSTDEIPTIENGRASDGRPLIHIVGLDSNPLTSIIADGDDRYGWQKYSMGMLEFLKREMETDAVFKIGMAHHPYLSNGSHGNAGSYDGFASHLFPAVSGQRWKEFLEEGLCDKADFFMNGHDHDLELLKPVTSCGRTQFALSGAAGKFRSLTDENRNDTYFQVGDTYGFMWMQAIEGNPATGEPNKMCVESYVVDPENDNGFGVFDGTQLTPAHRICLDQQPMTGMVANTNFSQNTIPATVPLAVLPTSFDADYRGIVGEFRAELITALNQANQNNPSPQAGVVAADMVVAIDTLLMAIDGIATSLVGDTSDLEKAFAAVLATAKHLENVDTSALPAPYNQLGNAFEAFAAGDFMMTADEGSSGSEDVAYLTAPLVSLAANLANIIDATHEQTAELPVVHGVTGLLAAVVVGTAETLGYLTELEANDSQEALIGGIDRGLSRVVEELQQFANLPEPLPTVLSGALTDVLATFVREITEQLDRRVLNVLGGVIDIALTPFTNIVRELVEFLVD